MNKDCISNDVYSSVREKLVHTIIHIEGLNLQSWHRPYFEAQ